jgi:hypothetical protein
MYLFLLSLLIGFAEGQVINPRMALAAHLEGLNWLTMSNVANGKDGRLIDML